MKKSRLPLYIGMPVFGLLLLALTAVWPDLIYANIVTFIFGIYISEVHRELATPLVIMSVVAFWLLIAYGVGVLWGHFERSKRKRDRRHPR